jgi:hypothetical protein
MQAKNQKPNNKNQQQQITPPKKRFCSGLGGRLATSTVCPQS